MKLDIKTESDPVLRQPTEEINDFDFELQTLIDNMIETMRAYEGVGLAAPQVGVAKKLLICEFAGDKEAKVPAFPLTVLCNPKITKLSKSQKNLVEGCLSVPGREIIIKRPTAITVLGQDRYGNDQKIEAKGLFARTIQHEIDHLNATLIIDHIQKSRVIFIGTGSLGVSALKLLLNDTQYEVVLVVTGSKTAKVRGQSIENNEIYKIARDAGVSIIRTERVGEEKVIKEIKRSKPDVGIIADFGQIIPKEILAIPKHGIVNIHPSLLPKHRGPSPIQQTILDGDQKTGLTLIVAGPECDAGEIISQGSINLSGSETTTILKQYFSENAGSYLLSILPYYLSGELKPKPQNEQKATKTKLFSKSDGLVGVNTPAIEIERKIRAFDQWPKVHIEIGGKKIQLLSAHFDEAGKLIIDRVKPEGKKEMSYGEFKNGYGADLTFSA